MAVRKKISGANSASALVRGNWRIPIANNSTETPYYVEPDDLTGKIVNAKWYGATGGNVADDTAAIHAARDAAAALGSFAYVYLPRGTYSTTGLDFSSTNVLLIGDGPSTIIQAVTGITGPVINMTSRTDHGFEERYPMGNFQVIGDNTAGADKHGIVLSNAHNIVLENIGIEQTGGIPLKIYDTGGQCHFGVANNCTFSRPVSAGANNVPYLSISGICNGWSFTNCGFRSLTTDADAAKGVVEILYTSTNYAYPSYTSFTDCWMEYQHPADGQALIMQTGGNFTVHRNWKFFDESKNAAYTNTAYFKITEVASLYPYGCIIEGHIPGNQGNATSIDWGVWMAASRNRISGVRGYKGSNVYLASGVNMNFIEFTGSQSVTAATATAAVTDDSGNADNVVLDAVTATYNWNTFIKTSYDPTVGAALQRKIGFFNATPVPKPEVTGVRDSNAALASLLTKLADLGLITDSTTAT